MTARRTMTDVLNRDSRLAMLRQGLEALLEPGPGRAETIQLLFSLDYDPQWRKRFELEPTTSSK